MKLDLGCGKCKKEGFIGLDIYDYLDCYPKKEFIQHDLREALPFKNESINEIYASHILEHFDYPIYINIMNEIYRVLKVDSKLTIKVPHFSGEAAFKPYHTIHFAVNSFAEFTDRIENYWKPQQIRFRLISKRIKFIKRKLYFWNYLIEKIINLDPHIQNLYELTFLKALFPAFEIEFNLIKI